jgi:hypothetical protein
LARSEKELKDAEKDKKFLTRYIMRKKEDAQRKEAKVRRKAKEEAWKKAEEEAQRKETIKDIVVQWSDEDQNFKYVRT